MRDGIDDLFGIRDDPPAHDQAVLTATATTAGTPEPRRRILDGELDLLTKLDPRRRRGPRNQRRQNDSKKQCTRGDPSSSSQSSLLSFTLRPPLTSEPVYPQRPFLSVISVTDLPDMLRDGGLREQALLGTGQRGRNRANRHDREQQAVKASAGFPLSVTCITSGGPPPDGQRAPTGVPILT